MLAALLDNGGGTLTHALLPTSPAMDAADPVNFPADDQRKFVRPVDGGDDLVALPDIGAFEWPPDCNGNGIPDNFEVDTDGDAFIDACDGCPTDPNKVAPGACGCGLPDIDSDGDGVLDCQDNCPDDPNKTEPGVCGCGISDVDTDQDGTADCSDHCPNDSGKVEPGLCGCGVVDDPTDSDGDTIIDCNDDCPLDPAKTEPGICGCGVSDGDTDGDGVRDCDDICEGGDDNIDCDGDGTPDFCDTEPDCDGNGKSDVCDIDISDPDGDGIVAPDCNNNLVPDECDIADGLADDCNGNGLIDQCEIDPLTIVYDIRKEDLINLTSSCPSTPTNLFTDNRQPFGFTWQDRGRGIISSLEIHVQPGSNCHTAGTSFGTTLNGFDEAPLILPTRHCSCNLSTAPSLIAVPDLGNYLPGQVNTFMIGVSTTRIGLSPNAAWGDGVYARVMVSFDQATVTDCNGNGDLDDCEIAAGIVDDCDLNGIVDSCEPDCNTNGTVDACDIDQTDPDGDFLVSADCDANGVPDECQVNCNEHGLPDSCDVDPVDPDGNGLTSADCNANGIPDECETDCNGNLIPDECELLSEMIYDISANQVVNVSLCDEQLMGNTSSFGFTWMDTTPGPVIDVAFELNIGVQCETAGTEHPTTLNGAAGDTYVAPTNRCTCSPGTGIVVPLGANATDYLTGQENTLLLTGMSGSGVGFAPIGPLGPGVFGRVTVRFDNSAVLDANGNGVLDACESPADLDGSGAVDLGDFAVLQPCVAGPGGGIPAGCEGTDVNGDGQVSLDDFSILQIDFNPPLP